MRSAATVRAALALLLAGALSGCDRSTGVPTADRLEVLSPAAQTATVGTAVGEPPAVRVLSGSGAAVADIAVTFTVVSGDGSVTGQTQRTDTRGEARLGGWTLGTRAGENVVHAAAAGIGAVAIFRATGTPDAPASLEIVTQPPLVAYSGAVLNPPAAVKLLDRHGNTAAVAGVRITALVLEPGAQLEDAVALTDADGIARFTWLTLHGSAGAYTFAFSAPGLGSVVALSSLALAELPAGLCPDPLQLDFAPGELRRVTLDSSRGLSCFEFAASRNAGQQFLVMLENMPLYGGYETALFPFAVGGSISERTFDYTFRSTPRAGTAPAHFAPQRALAAPAPVGPVHSWNFGAGTLYEHRPEEPPGGVTMPRFRAASGQLVDVTSSTTGPQVGDTIFGIRMEGIARLGIPTGEQAAVVRHVSADLIIAEDVRLTTVLRRQSGGFNTPLHPDTMRAIAEQYAALVRPQGDRLFAGRHNAAVENTTGGRVVAVHSLMYRDNVWGYTYSSGNYFVWDYWVGTDGTSGTINQHVQRNVDNLFMHEIAHMREFGLLQHAGTVNRRGNQWLVEGFARFSERLPIATRLLGTPEPSRTGNIVLPYNPAYGGGYFRDDVPTYLSLGSPMLDGYQNSSYVFDYFADQVALRGGDWHAALREFVTAAGRPDVLDGVVDRWVGGTFAALFTRARLALYLDDIGIPGLPAWTQYHQYRLRDSRPVGTGTDPRDAWARLAPGTWHEIVHSIPAGGAWGYVIDGAQGAASTLYQLTGPRTGNAVLSVTRIR
jgi:hypothetical protein